MCCFCVFSRFRTIMKNQPKGTNSTPTGDNPHGRIPPRAVVRGRLAPGKTRREQQINMAESRFLKKRTKFKFKSTQGANSKRRLRNIQSCNDKARSTGGVHRKETYDILLTESAPRTGARRADGVGVVKSRPSPQHRTDALVTVMSSACRLHI